MVNPLLKELASHQELRGGCRDVKIPWNCAILVSPHKPYHIGQGGCRMHAFTIRSAIPARQPREYWPGMRTHVGGVIVIIHPSPNNIKTFRLIFRLASFEHERNRASPALQFVQHRRQASHLARIIREAEHEIDRSPSSCLNPSRDSSTIQSFLHTPAATTL
jgi:hypothetical protein